MQKGVLLICLISVILISGCLNTKQEVKMIKENKKLEIDFLYLDLSTCDRCQATDKVLDEALDELRGELKYLKELTVKKIKILNDKEAKKYNFVRSPTIKLNGVDIEKILTGELEIKDNYCESCAGICKGSCLEVTGGGTQCRIVEYKGKTYETVPKEMIEDAIRKVLGIKTKEEFKSKNSPCGCGSDTNNVC